MPVISVNISDLAKQRLTKSAKALGMTRSKMFEYLISNMDVLLPKSVLPLMDEIIELQDKLQKSLSTEDQTSLRSES